MIKDILSFILFCCGVVWVTGIIVMMMLTVYRFLKNVIENLFHGE